MTHSVIDSLLQHRSIRRWKPDPIPEDVLTRILSAGTRAATCNGLQHYSLIVVDDPAKKEALIDGPLNRAPALLVAAVDYYRLKRWLAAHGEEFVEDHIQNLFMGFWDAILAVQNVVVAAESLGLGTVYISRAPTLDTMTILDTPEYVMPVALVAMGYPDEAPEQRPRLPLEAVVHRNSYRRPEDDDEARGYHTNKEASSVVGMHRRWEAEQRCSARILENLRRTGFKLDQP